MTTPRKKTAHPLTTYEWICFTTFSMNLVMWGQLYIPINSAATTNLLTSSPYVFYCIVKNIVRR